MSDCLKRIILPLFIVAFFLLALLANLRALTHNCFNITDFGILQEAIAKMPFQLNPLIVVRGLFAWADHFDPITLAASPGLILSNFNPHFLIFWEWMFWAAGALFIYLGSGRKEVILLWPFSRPLLEALLYPIHPNTWTMFPLLLLGWALAKERWRMVVILSALLPLYREIYPLCFVMLGLGMLITLGPRNRKVSGLVFAISLIWILLIFVVRPMVAGPLQNYAGPILSLFSQNLLQAINYVWEIQKWGAMLKLFGPLCLLLILSPYLQKRSGKQSLLLACFFFAPYFGAHFLFGQFMHHYGVPFASVALGLVAFLPGEKIPANRWAPIMLVFILAASSSWTKFFQYAFATQTKRCELSSEHKLATEELLAKLHHARRPKKILASGGLIPQLISADRDIYHLYSWLPHQKSYDYFVYERHGTGAHHPLSAEEIETLIEQCRPLANNILIDNKYYIAMEGHFNEECATIAGRSLGKQP